MHTHPKAERKNFNLYGKYALRDEVGGIYALGGPSIMIPLKHVSMSRFMHRFQDFFATVNQQIPTMSHFMSSNVVRSTDHSKMTLTHATADINANTNLSTGRSAIPLQAVNRFLWRQIPCPNG